MYCDNIILADSVALRFIYNAKRSVWCEKHIRNRVLSTNKLTKDRMFVIGDLSNAHICPPTLQLLSLSTVSSTSLLPWHSCEAMPRLESRLLRQKHRAVLEVSNAHTF